MTNSNLVTRHLNPALVLAGFAVLIAQPAYAQPQPANDKPALSIDKVEPAAAGLGDTLKVTIKNWPKDKPAPKDWVLHLDGVPLSGIHADNTDVRDGVVRFYLQRDERSKGAWAILLRELCFEREVAVAVGPESGADTSIASLTTGFRLVVIPQRRSVIYLICFGVVVIVLLYLGSTTSLLRDSDTDAPANYRPLSLGRVQMAWWFLLIWGSYLYIGLVTWDYSRTMSGTALVLMGISAATAFGAVLIDLDKRRQTEALQAENAALPGHVAQLQQTVAAAAGAAPLTPVTAANLGALNNDLHQKQIRQNEVTTLLAQRINGLALRSGGIFDDLLRDANGISLHRFQMVVWTLTLGAVFVCSVVINLAMPEFNPTLLALMGISSGTYIGFKFPERKA
jgi:hypothetical protein